jgi:hypothetical protein
MYSWDMCDCVWDMLTMSVGGSCTCILGTCVCVGHVNHVCGWVMYMRILRTCVCGTCLRVGHVYAFLGHVNHVCGWVMYMHSWDVCVWNMLTMSVGGSCTCAFLGRVCGTCLRVGHVHAFLGHDASCLYTAG